MRKKIFYRLTDNCQSFMTGNSQHSLKQSLGLLTSVLGLQNILVLIRSMLNYLFISAVEARGKTVYYSDTELLPFPLTSAGAYPIHKGRPRCTPGCSLYRKPRGREHLGAMLFSTKCWPGAQGSWDTRHDRKHINRQIQWQSQWWIWGCATCNQLKNQEQISFLYSPFHRLFTFFLTPLCLCFSGVHYYSPLPLFPWHSTFYLVSSFSLQYFFFLLLLFSCWLSAVFPPFFNCFFSLTAGDWAKACRSQSITFKEFRIKVLFPLASLLLLQSLFLCSILCGVFLLKDGLLQYAGKEEGL